MNKKLLMLVMLLCLGLLITGCGKGKKEKDEKTGVEKTVYECVKNDVSDSSSSTNIKWKEDITYTAKLTEDGKLDHYTMKFVYKYENNDNCNYYCDVKTKWNNDINAKNYSGLKRETNCRCDSLEVTENYEYDISNLEKTMRIDIKELKEDDSFDLDAWIEKYEKAKFNCS